MDGEAVNVRGMTAEQVADALETYRTLLESHLLDAPTAEIRQALTRVAALAIVQGRRGQQVHTDLLATLAADPELLDPVPHASVEQARRMAARRNQLLASGAWNVAALSAARDAKPSAVRMWLARQRDGDRLFTVTVRGETYVPALLLREDAEPHPGLERVIHPLRSAGLDPWALWVWFDSPSPWLDGDRPAALVAAGEVDRAAAAATAKASNAADEDPATNAA